MDNEAMPANGTTSVGSEKEARATEHELGIVRRGGPKFIPTFGLGALPIFGGIVALCMRETLSLFFFILFFYLSFFFLFSNFVYLIVC